MHTFFARSVVALCLLALPASALASTQATAQHHGTAQAAKKEFATKKKGKHHGRRPAPTKRTTATANKAN